MDKLRKLACDLIISRLKTASVAAVASDLGISRQAVYNFKRGKYCPSLSLVQRACEAWKVKFSFRRHLSFDSKSFKETETNPPQTEPLPKDLFAQLDNRNFEVISTKPMGRALEITLRLTLPTYKTAGG